LGVNQPEASLGDFFNKKVPLKDTVRVYGNGSVKLGLVTGDIHSLESGRIKHTQNQKLFRQIRKLSADNILIDLGAGTHFSTLDSFLLADKKIVVIVPEITSIENMYQFIKTALFRKLHSSFSMQGLKYQFHNTWKSREIKKIKNINQFMDSLSKTSTEARDIVTKELQNFVIEIIVNQVRNDDDIKTGNSVHSVLLKYLGISSHHIGHIKYDDAVWNSIRAKKPVINASPSSESALNIQKVTENLIRGIH
jgi:flagellar biosynthesis protein FlhG